MKTTFLLALIFSFSFLSGQDSLYTTDGKELGVKVVEINKEEVKYIKSSNPDGPLYVIPKSEVALIEYRNGTKDVFTQSDNNKSLNEEPQQTVIVNPRPAIHVVVNALPALAWTALTWGWGWGGGWCRPARSYSHHHYGHHGHYGRHGRR